MPGCQGGLVHRQWIGLALAAVVVCASPLAAAPAATVTGVVMNVTYRSSPAAAWARARVGTTLKSGARVRTGARSKVEVRFPDGSRVRLNELSDLLITDAAAKGMSLARGNLYARVIAGTGARIAGARGVASIKGTVLSYDGETLAIYQGQATHELGRGNEEVAAGTASNCDVPGVFAVPGENWEGGQFRPWFTDLREGVGYDVAAGTPAGERARYAHSALWATAGGWATPPDTGGLDVIIEGASAEGGGATGSFAAGLFGALAGAGASGDSSTALPCIPQLGAGVFGPVSEAEFYAIDGTGADDLAGAQARVGFMKGNWFLGLGGMARACDLHGNSAVFLSEAFLNYRFESWGDLTLGRQWFIKVPVNNSRLGSLCTFDLADALRWQRTAGAFDFDVAYLNDMTVPSVEDRQGALARVQHYVLGGQVAINAL